MWKHWLAPTVVVVVPLAFIGAQDLGPSSDPVVDYFDVNPKPPTDIFNLGPDGQPTTGPGSDAFSVNPPRNCLDAARMAFSRGIPYGVIQDATRKRFYGYQPLGGVQGYLWETTGGVPRGTIGNFPVTANGLPRPSLGQMGPQGGIAGDDKPPAETRILCLIRIPLSGPCVACIGFPARRLPEKTRPALTSSDPCTQCNYTYDHQIETCRANIPVSTSDQYNKCIYDANQEHQRCIAGCRTPSGVSARSPLPRVTAGRNATPGFRQALADCLNRIQQLAAADPGSPINRLLGALRNIPITVNPGAPTDTSSGIVPSRPGQPVVISWKPDESGLYEDKATKIPCAILLHELTHAWEQYNGGTDSNEQQPVRAENWVIWKMGGKQRTEYQGRILPPNEVIWPAAANP